MSQGQWVQNDNEIYIWILKTEIRTWKRDYPWIESLSFRKSSKNQNWDYYTKHVCTSHFDHKINHCLPDDNKMQKPYPCGKWLKFNFRTIIENSLTVIGRTASLLLVHNCKMIITCYKNHFKSIFIFRQQPQVQLKHLQRLQQQLQPQQQHQRQGHSNGIQNNYQNYYGIQNFDR